MRQSPQNRRTIHRKHLAFEVGTGTGEGRAINSSANLLDVIAGENITEGDAVAIMRQSGVSVAMRADATAAQYHGTIGIATNSAPAGSTCSIITTGIYESARYAFTPGAQLYIIKHVSVNLTHLYPPLHVYRIGYALTATRIVVRPDLKVLRKS